MRTSPVRTNMFTDYSHMVEAALGEPSNENCTTGLRCPACLSRGPFTIRGEEWGDNGSSGFSNNWSGDDPCQCYVCQFEYLVDDFHEPVVTNLHVAEADDILDRAVKLLVLDVPIRGWEKSTFHMAYVLALTEQKTVLMEKRMRALAKSEKKKAKRKQKLAA